MARAMLKDQYSRDQQRRFGAGSQSPQGDGTASAMSDRLSRHRHLLPLGFRIECLMGIRRELHALPEGE
jgi:hypothetical protein